VIALPVRRDPAPPANRPASRAHAPAGPEAPSAYATAADGGPSLEERIDASVDAALAEALAKVSTPADSELAKQQQAFDRLMQARTEQLREANAIRDFGLAQMKKENEVLEEFIRMI
jgi:hypothetical protein